MSVTIKDLAKITGFSSSTISRALSNHGYVDETTRAAIQKAVEESGYCYKPSPSKRNSVKMVMIIMGEISNDVYAQNIIGISSVFDTRNIMYVGTYGDRYDTEKLEFYMRRAIASRFEGMILLTPIETPAFIKMMQTCSIPCISMNRPLEMVEMDQVCMDNKAAGRLAVQYLVQKGHRRIAFVSLTGISSAEYREKGYIDGLQKMGLKLCDEDIIQVNHTFEGGIGAGSIIAVSRKDITAVYAPNEMIARGVIEGLRRCGKRVPEDISVMATDNTQDSVLSSPSLTTVSCNHYEMGVQAALLFIERSKNPKKKKKKIFMEPEIIERDSVRSIEGLQE